MLRVTFGIFEFDSARRLLARQGTPVHLTRKAFLLLELLLRNRPAAVSKQDILDALWADCFVEEGSVASLVSELRNALGREWRPWVRTVHGFGYAFCGEAGDAPASGGPARFLLIERGPPPRSIGLLDGATVIGRGLDCDVRVASKKVSRSHARIRLADRAAVIEDLGSRNGTYVRGARVAGPIALADGDDIRLGTVELVFRVAADPESETEAPSKDGTT